jgi:hypothetical protein
MMTLRADDLWDFFGFAAEQGVIRPAALDCPYGEPYRSAET